MWQGSYGSWAPLPEVVCRGRAATLGSLERSANGDSPRAAAQRLSQSAQSRLRSQWEALPAAGPSPPTRTGWVNSPRPGSGSEAWNWEGAGGGEAFLVFFCSFLIAVQELGWAGMQRLSAEGWAAPPVGGGLSAIVL